MMVYDTFNWYVQILLHRSPILRFCEKLNILVSLIFSYTLLHFNKDLSIVLSVVFNILCFCYSFYQYIYIYIGLQ